MPRVLNCIDAQLCWNLTFGSVFKSKADAHPDFIDLADDVSDIPKLHLGQVY